MSKLSPPKKLLSFCITGRNDDYMPDFEYRLTTTINNLTEKLFKLGALDEVEIIVVDWGSEKPIHENFMFSEYSARITEFIYVPQGIIQEKYGDRKLFHTTAAFNTAIRRGRGDFILQYAADYIIQEHAISYLLKLLNRDAIYNIDIDKAFILIPRYQIPWQFIKRKPSINQIDNYINDNLMKFYLDKLYADEGGGFGGFLFHRNNWNYFRGLCEEMSGFGANDNEIFYRVKSKHKIFNTFFIGITLSHMEHEVSGSRNNILKDKRSKIKFYRNDVVNDENWGLGNYDLSRFAARYSRNRAENKRSMTNTFLEPANLCNFVNDTPLKTDLNKIFEELFRYPTQRIDSIKKPLLCLFLVYYCKSALPFKALCFGMKDTYYDLIIAGTCKSTVIYDVNNLKDHCDSNQNYLEKTGEFLGKLSAVEHRGLINFFDLREWKQGIQVQGGTTNHDLILVSQNHLNSYDDLLYIINLLSENGILIFDSDSLASINKYITMLRTSFPDSKFIMHDKEFFFVFLKNGWDFNISNDFIMKSNYRLDWKNISPAFHWRIYRFLTNRERVQRLYRRFEYWFGFNKN